MRITIAVFITLIVGSESGLLGNILSPVQLALNSATASAEAQKLVNELTAGIGQVTNEAAQNISGQVQTVRQSYHQALNTALTLAQGQLSVSEAAELTVQVTSSLANLTISTANLITQTTAALNSLSTQLADTINPSIQSLIADVLSGSTKLQCFTNEIPKIRTDIIELVAATRTELVKAVLQQSQKIVDDIAFVNGILSEIEVAIQTGTLNFSTIQKIITAPVKISSDLQQLRPQIEIAVTVVITEAATKLIRITADVVKCL